MIRPIPGGRLSAPHRRCNGRPAGAQLAAAAFAGILADPVQRKLRLHQRRLHRLIDAVERQWNTERREAGFVARDPYVARLLDLFDLLGDAYQLAKA